MKPGRVTEERSSRPRRTRCRPLDDVVRAEPGPRGEGPLEALVARRGGPGVMVGDNGTEFTSTAVLTSTRDHEVHRRRVAPLGSAPIRNRAAAVEVATVLGPPGSRLSPSLAEAERLLVAFGSCVSGGGDASAILASLGGLSTPGFDGAQAARALAGWARSAAARAR